MRTYRESDLEEKKQHICKKCNKEVYRVKLKDKPHNVKYEWQTVDLKKLSTRTFYTQHYLACFPEGYRFNFGDKIIYSPFNSNVDGIYKIIGIDEYNNSYILKDCKNLDLSHITNYVYFVDKNAIPLTEEAELLYGF